MESKHSFLGWHHYGLVLLLSAITGFSASVKLTELTTNTAPDAVTWLNLNGISGGSQSPWTGDIDGGGFALTNAAQVIVSNSVYSPNYDGLHGDVPNFPSGLTVGQYGLSDAGVLVAADGSGVTNINPANIGAGSIAVATIPIGNVVTDGRGTIAGLAGTNVWTGTSNSFQVVNATKILVGGAQAGADAVNITGTLQVSAAVSGGNGSFSSVTAISGGVIPRSGGGRIKASGAPSGAASSQVISFEGTAGDRWLTNLIFAPDTAIIGNVGQYTNGIAIKFAYTNCSVTFETPTPSTNPVNLLMSGSLTATNGVYVVAPTNVMNGLIGNVYPTTTTNIALQATPVGRFGYLGFFGTNTLTAGAQNVYVNLSTNGILCNRVLTNGFGANTNFFMLTNSVAGYYGVSYGMKADGLAGLGEEFELEVHINGVAEEFLSMSATTAGINDHWNVQGDGVIYLAAGSVLDLRIKGAANPPSNLSVNRAWLRIGTP